MAEIEFTALTAFAADATRVGLVICERCHAAILVDPRDPENRLQGHAAWHEELDKAIRRAEGSPLYRKIG